MVEAKLLRKKLKNGLIVDKWDLVNIIEKQQAEIERLTTKNLEWLANWNEQQAEIEALKKSINEALASIPAYGEQGFYFEHHDINGEYLGHSSIHAEDVVQRIEAILRKAQEK